MTTSISRRTFLQLLAAVTPAVKTLAGASLHEASGLEDILAMERSVNFGLTSKGVPLAVGSLYRETTESASELSFDISNNQISASLTCQGEIRRACLCEGVSPLTPDKIKGGVYCTKHLLYGGPWFLKVRLDSRDSSEEGVEVSLIENLFPMFTRKIGDMRIHQLFFAPVDLLMPVRSPRALIVVVLIENRGTASHTVELFGSHGSSSPTEISLSADSSSAEAHDVVADVAHRAVFRYVDFDTAGLLEQSDSVKTSSVHVLPNSLASLAKAWILGESEAEAEKTRQQLSSRSAVAWFHNTLDLRRQSYGSLSIPGDPFAAESVIRLSELSRQSALRSSDGRVCGGFLGSDVDVNQVNWTRDSYYSMLAMSFNEPSLTRDSIPYLLEWGQPLQTTGSGRARFPNAKPVSQSVSNSLSGLAIASSYYRSTGDRDFFIERPAILRSARSILEQVLASRRSSVMLFPSLYFSDGEARGDFHTGSNIAAWVAFSGMARIAGEVYGDEKLAQDWSIVARDIHEAIDSHCVGGTESGRRFFEGANIDGSFVQGHDGEESETTLMPFYGFCRADDARLLNHASSAMTVQNPLYSSALDAIWWYNSEWKSATFPGWTTALAGASDETQIRSRLCRIRSLTDLDGAVWWWPYPYGAKDPSLPTRGIGARKCGWGAGVFICRFINDILGISVDTPSRSVRFAPFSPWNNFAWERAKIGWSSFDLSYDCNDQRITATLMNRNSSRYSATIILTPERAKSLKDAEVTGGHLTGQSRIEHWGRPALELTLLVQPGQRVQVAAEIH